MEPVRLWRYMVPAGSDLYGKQKPAWTDLARVNPSPYEQEYAALPRADFTALLAEHDALREALILWQEWSANYSPAECADGSGYYSESDHDQAECAKIARAALSASAAPPPSPPPPPSRVEEAQRKVLDAAKALREADTAYTDLYSSVKDDEDARDEARGRLDHLHAVRLNKRFDLDAYTDELLAAERGEGGGV